MSNQIVQFGNSHLGGGRRNLYTAALRRIEVTRKGKPALVLATNDLKSVALAMAERYKVRWHI